jgi:hypothetical protein
MRYGLFAALAALSGTVLVAHPNLALAAPPEPIKEQITALNKSYSDFSNQTNDFLENVGKDPSHWVFRIGKIEVPMTKELAAEILRGNGGWLTPPPGQPGVDCINGNCLCFPSGGNICYAK